MCVCVCFLQQGQVKSQERKYICCHGYLLTTEGGDKIQVVHFTTNPSSPVCEKNYKRLGKAGEAAVAGRKVGSHDLFAGAMHVVSTISAVW